MTSNRQALERRSIPMLFNVKSLNADLTSFLTSNRLASI